MSTSHFTHFVFVDFENVPNIELGRVAGKPVHVSLLLGKNQRNLDVGLVQSIHRLAAQVQLVEVGASGHNALDLTLAFYLGQAVERAPAAQFCIVSKDKDFDPLVGHLERENVKVARFDSFAALPFFPRSKKSAPVATKPPVDRRAKVIARLMNPANLARPSSRAALLAHIKTALGKEASEAAGEDILDELVARKALAIDARGKVSYAA